MWVSVLFNIDTGYFRYLTVRYQYGFDIDKSRVETSMIFGLMKVLKLLPDVRFQLSSLPVPWGCG